MNNPLPDTTSMTPPWTDEMHAAGLAEGWLICHCDGSENGLWQLDCVDSPNEWVEQNGGAEPPSIADEDAWVIVANGGLPHHLAALEFLRAHNPQEYTLVIAKKKEEP